MSMFTNYETKCIADKPDNVHDNPAYTYDIVNTDIPKKMYDVNNKFKGYSWKYGDIFTLVLDVNKPIKVNRESIIYTVSGQVPGIWTRGHKGQQAYNTMDNKSWTCVGLSNGYYIWILDDHITYDSNGTKEIIFNRDMTDKTLKVTIYNFRWEPIKTFSTINSNTICIDINESISQELKSGLYTCTIAVNDIEEQRFNISVI